MSCGLLCVMKCSGVISYLVRSVWARLKYGYLERSSSLCDVVHWQEWNARSFESARGLSLNLSLSI